MISDKNGQSPQVAIHFHTGRLEPNTVDNSLSGLSFIVVITQLDHYFQVIVGKYMFFTFLKDGACQYTDIFAKVTTTGKKSDLSGGY